MAVGDLYRTKHFQSLAGQQILNVYYFEQTVGSGGAQDLNLAFTLDVLPKVKANQSSQVLHTFLESESLDDPGDFATLSLGNSPGDDGTAFMPTFVAWGFQMVRATKTTRHGYKRIAGMVESKVTDGVADASATAELQAYADIWPGPITDALGNEFDIKIIRNPDDPGTRVVNDVAECVYQRVTTQNTRKVGLGA